MCERAHNHAYVHCSVRNIEQKVRRRNDDAGIIEKHPGAYGSSLHNFVLHGFYSGQSATHGRIFSFWRFFFSDDKSSVLVIYGGTQYKDVHTIGVCMLKGSISPLSHKKMCFMLLFFVRHNSVNGSTCEHAMDVL